MYNLTMLFAITEIVFSIVSIRKKYFFHASFIFANVGYELDFFLFYFIFKLYKLY